MTIIRFQASPIESLAPYTDARDDISNSRRVSPPSYVLDGKNFFFDSLGPKSGFTSEFLTYTRLGDCEGIHGVHAGGKTFVFTQEAILLWSDIAPAGWQILYTFAEPLPYNSRTPWSVFYSDDSWYFFHETRGSYKADYYSNDIRVFVKPIEPTDSIGLLLEVKAAFMVRGRPIIINESTIQWGAVANMADLTPSLAGAGVQVISDLVQGTFVAAVGFEDGFIVWTSEGTLRAEYIGGALVWRFSALYKTVRPLNSWSITRLPSGETVFLSLVGLVKASIRDEVITWAQSFNEYLRGYLLSHREHANHWRLEYDETLHLIYIMEANGPEGLYHRTFALTPTLGKWGVFSAPVFGLLPYYNGAYGYVGTDHYPKYFTGKMQNEVLPEPDSSVNLHVARVEKICQTPSSSVVCSAQGNANTLATADELVATLREGLFSYGLAVRAARTYGAQDAEILIGYLRPQGVSISIDDQIQIQEIAISTPSRKPPSPMDWTSQWKPEMYIESEDLNTATQDEDWNTVGSSEDWNIALIDEDWEVLSGAEDWEIEQEIQYREDYESYYAMLPEITMQLVLEMSEDGITFDTEVPEIVRFNTKLTYYSALTRGVYHRLRVTANEKNDYFHLTHLEFTMSSGGQVL